MTRQELFLSIQKKRSFLCIGLDPVMDQLPPHLLDLEDPVLEFNRQIIEATHDLCIAYKPNTAFYECLGPKGWQTLQKTLKSIPANIFTIADAKRGDIGNTSAMYAAAFFSNDPDKMDFDAMTVAPYMGKDSVEPFLSFKGKWVVLLALTSNKGHQDFQLFNNGKETLFEKVITASKEWAGPDQLMYVVGATHPAEFKKIRELAPENFLLVPGVGAQGGDLQEVCKFGLNSTCGLIVNAGRSVLYAGKERDFAVKARAEALKIQKEMDVILTSAGL